MELACFGVMPFRLVYGSIYGIGVGWVRTMGIQSFSELADVASFINLAADKK